MPEPGTPTDWTDAYREVMETVWLATEPDVPGGEPTPQQAAQETSAQTALLAFAAEIRLGLAAGLLAPYAAGPTAPADCSCDQGAFQPLELHRPYCNLHPTGYGAGPIVDPDSGRHGPQA